jgi:hypothetical protein
MMECWNNAEMGGEEKEEDRRQQKTVGSRE